MADEIILRIRAEGVDQVMKEIKKTGAVIEDTGDKAEKSSKKMSSTFGKLGKTIGAAFAVTTLIQFGKQMTRLAVDIDATGAKLRTVFGEATREVERFAKANATSLGLTVNEYKKAAAAVGDLLIPIGFQRREAAGLSNDLVKLSGALSAWTGGQLNATQVSEILTKALLGEREQLKQLGIQISEADVKARLLEKGQSKLTGSMLAQAKATATLELITEKSADAQAAFADDTKTLAESQLELRANFRQLADDLAQAFIPALASASGGLVKFIDTWKQIGKIRRDEIDYTSELSALIVEQSDDIIHQLDLRKKQAEAALESAEANAKGSIIIGKLEKDVIAVNAAIEANKVSNEDLARTIAELNLVRRLETNWTEEQALKLQILLDVQKALNEEKGAPIIETQVQSLKLLEEQLKDQQEIVKEAEAYSAEQVTAQKEVNRLTDEIKELKKFLDDIGKVNKVEFDFVFTDALAGITDFINAVAGDIESDLEPVLLGVGDMLADGLAMPEGFDKMKKDAQDAAQAARDAFWEMDEEVADKTLTTFSKIGEAVNAFGEISKQVSEARIANLEREKEQGIISEQQFQEKRAEILNEQAKKDKAASIFKTAIGTAAAIVQALNSPPPASFVFAALAGAIGAAQLATIAATPIPQYAEGTKGRKKAPRGWAWVGEEGPELMQMRGGEKIVTAQDSEQLIKLLSGYGIPVQFRSTHEQLYKPMSGIAELKKSSTGINWNPLLMSNEKSRHYSGRKLDRIYEELHKLNGNFGRRMTRA